MGTAPQSTYSLLSSLREHVLSPIETAEERVAAERTEVAAERDEYEKFHDRVSGIKTVPVSRSPATTTTRAYVDSRPHAVDTIRSAFRATVMSVDHYDRVYDESLDDHVAAELSPDVAALFQDTSGKPFTEPAKTVLTSTVQRAIDGRNRFLEILDREQDSVEASREAVTDILDEHDGPRVPDWYRDEFETTLDEVAEQRQETLHTRQSTARTDGHDLCTYLYKDKGWTYPVLNTVTRFRRSVITDRT